MVRICKSLSPLFRFYLLSLSVLNYFIASAVLFYLFSSTFLRPFNKKLIHTFNTVLFNLNVVFPDIKCTSKVNKFFIFNLFTLEVSYHRFKMYFCLLIFYYSAKSIYLLQSFTNILFVALLSLR